MPTLDLSVDELLTTTRAVRRRLDLSRPVEPEVIRECLNLAVQAPTPGTQQNWHFVVVTDASRRDALAELYRRSARAPGGQEDVIRRAVDAMADRQEAARIAAKALYLTDHLHEVPVHVVPCIEGRAEHLPAVERAGQWAGIWPATWSFMLAARSRGLGTVLTTLHLRYEREAADVLGIPYEQVMQAGLIPLAHTVGTTFKPAARKPLDEVVHWDRW